MNVWMASAVKGLCCDKARTGKQCAVMVIQDNPQQIRAAALNKQRIQNIVINSRVLP